MRTPFIACALIGCNLDSTLPAAGDDAAVDAPDADLRRCDPTKPFGPAAPVPGMSRPNIDEFCTRLSGNQLTAVTSINDGSVLDLFVATRASDTGTFDVPDAIANVNSVNTEQCPFLSDTGLELFFASDRPGGIGGFDIYLATRSSTITEFGTPALVANVNTASTASFGDHTPYVVPNALYLATGADIVRAPRQQDGSYGTPQRLATLSQAFEANPTVTPDELTIYFARGATGFAGTDIFVGRRDSISEDFGTPEPVAELNTDLREEPNWISPDGCDLYFLRETTISNLKLDLFTARRGL